MSIRRGLAVVILVLVGGIVGAGSLLRGGAEAAPAQAQVSAPLAAPAVPGCWGMVPSPNPGPDVPGYGLNDVAVISANDVWAVGVVGDANYTSHALTQHWDGTAWTIIATPLLNTSSSLSGVVALASNDVWAVGTYAGHINLALHWNGSAWSQVYTPVDPNWTESSFNNVAAHAPNDVWAVGYYYEPGNNGHRTLTEHWNGTAWSIIASPNNYERNNDLNAVTAIAANNAWAVGTYVDSIGHTLIEHWDGTAWTIVLSPNGSTNTNILYDVAAASASDVWAVGSDAGAGMTGRQALILHWNGTQWSIVPSANFGPGANELLGVAVRAGNDVWAVGGVNMDDTLPTFHWDGTSWSFVGGVGAPDRDYLGGVAIVNANQVWAVGVASANSGTSFPNLTARYDFPCIAPTPVPPSATPVPTATPPPTTTPHAGQFEDVPPGNPFYSYIECMGTRQIISGYPCGGPGEACVGPANKPYFRPNNNVTRGQTAKIVSNAAGWSEQSTFQHFVDVPPNSTFWIYVERAAIRGVISGYPCGGPGEPCTIPGEFYYRPNNPVTRGQTAKIVAIAAQFTETPTAHTFEDVPPSGTFYLWVERMASRGIIGGYPCGGAGEPCQPPANRPYFRPNNNVTRGQTAKIVTNSFFPNCQNPSPTPTTTTTAPPATGTATPEPPSPTSTPLSLARR